LAEKIDKDRDVVLIDSGSLGSGLAFAGNSGIVRLVFPDNADINEEKNPPLFALEVVGSAARRGFSVHVEYVNPSTSALIWTASSHNQRLE